MEDALTLMEDILSSEPQSTHRSTPQDASTCQSSHTHTRTLGHHSTATSQLAQRGKTVHTNNPAHQLAGVIESSVTYVYVCIHVHPHFEMVCTRTSTFFMYALTRTFFASTPTHTFQKSLRLCKNYMTLYVYIHIIAGLSTAATDQPVMRYCSSVEGLTVQEQIKMAQIMVSANMTSVLVRRYIYYGIMDRRIHRGVSLSHTHAQGGSCSDFHVVYNHVSRWSPYLCTFVQGSSVFS